MEYAFIGMMIPNEMSDKLFRISKKDMQDAANALQWHLYHGLCRNLNTEITLINTLPVGSYPQFCSRAFIPRAAFETKERGKHVNVGFCNIKLIRNYSKTRNIKKELARWIQRTNGEKTIFVYTASAVVLSAVRDLKKRYPELIVCDIIADLPAFSSLSSKQSILARQFGSYMARKAQSCLDAVDYFVLLTAQMADYLHIQKPFCVMEGIAAENPVPDHETVPETTDSDQKTVFYSGTLHKRFGIMHLLEAFCAIPNENYRLQLCGVGDCEDEIRAYARRDGRIEFLGRLPRTQALALQRRATVLVNPRQNNEAFTKYSFPSKNLEYLASGVPVIAYKLDGIPDEYDPYLQYVDDDSVQALSKKITEVCQLSARRRRMIGEQASAFVSREKNELVQTQKIAKLLSSE